MTKPTVFGPVVYEIAKTELPYLSKSLKNRRVNDFFLVRADLNEPVYGVSEELGPMGSQSIQGSMVLVFVTVLRFTSVR